MTIRTLLRLSSESALLEGEPAEVDAKRRAAHADEVRQARVEIARRTSRWIELEEVDLVERGRYLVSAETDALYTRRRGVIFEPGSASPVADMTELYFVVDPEGALAFFERVPGVATWSEHVARRAEREHRRAAPKPPMRGAKA